MHNQLQTPLPALVATFYKPDSSNMKKSANKKRQYIFKAWLTQVRHYTLPTPNVIDALSTPLSPDFMLRISVRPEIPL